ncbi:aldehyde dehydrogenase family protein [Microterricola pindariensis]|uniref:Aldehyde dehydrogenase domain-containing protein n=1 Tax=Microterricola pindariensis TaxID=478010 RepID=A0ABX5ATZ0_9MICO|nr:aldehyde dehydrogenase family protein [Microterricola pindariensis]PPL17193.1 hypothetical protein GY24_11710 [Microterricola pindariensis]
MSITATATAQLFIAGAWQEGTLSPTTLTDKYDNSPIATVATASKAQVSDAIGHALASWQKTPLQQAERAQILDRAAELVRRDATHLIATVMADTGFAIADATKEVERSIDTFKLCAEEARRLGGEMVPLAGVPGNHERIAFTRRHPLGVVVAITPFNSPLNTVVHKVGPAIAAGNAVVLKPATQTPLSAAALVGILLEAGLPSGLITLLYGSGGSVGQWLAEDPRPAFYAFTGSTRVGQLLHATVGMRPIQLEMGSLASTIICADADLARAATLAANAAFRKSGQVCTSVQRLYVHRDVQSEVAQRITERVASLPWGDPRNAATIVGPLVSPPEAERVELWINKAANSGAAILSGGTRHGNVIAPTVIADAPDSSLVFSKEIFGPVVVLRPFDELAEAISGANDTPYGLAAGIFTRDIDSALTAAEQLRFGSVHINETSSSRVDLMPFSGIKASGFGGAEGPKYAVRDMSEERLITLSRA